MKISILIEREPFKDIFEKTLTSFLNDFYDADHLVEWQPNEILVKHSNSTQQWYCNPHINSVFIKGVNPNVFEPINGEYEYNPLRPWRSIIQRIYLFLAQSQLTAMMLSKYQVNISPPIKAAENKLIIGGNTKLRLIDVLEKKVYVLLKEGFDKKYIKNEIYLRERFPYLPIPRIIESSSDKHWYCEEYISGKPPNRLVQSNGKKVLLRAIKIVHQVLIETKRNVTLSEYAEILHSKIYTGIDQILHMNNEVAGNLKTITSEIKSHLQKYEQEELTLAYCHGDFHQGNILSDGEEFWILDWEYSGEKQIGYDLFILLLDSRIEQGFSSRFLNLVNNQLDDFQKKIIDNWPELKWNDNSHRTIYLLVFLLEELVFYINESQNHLFYKKTNILENRCKEIKQIVDSLI